MQNNHFGYNCKLLLQASMPTLGSVLVWSRTLKSDLMLQGDFNCCRGSLQQSPFAASLFYSGQSALRHSVDAT